MCTISCFTFPFVYTVCNITKFIDLPFVNHLIRRDREISGPQPLTQQHIEFTSTLAILTSIPLLYKIISKRFRRGIHILVSSKSTALLVIWERWESANIDFICFANKGVNHPHRKQRPGIPRDSRTFVFQFARAAANHLCKNLRNPLSGSTVTTVAYRYFPSAKRRSTVLFGKFYCLQLGYVRRVSLTAGLHLML